MTPAESKYPADWVRVADQDWQRVGRLLEAGDPSLAGFCLQQALEKHLKAYLLARGWRLRRIHDLEALLDEATEHEPRLESYRSLCQVATAYYTAQRYPFSTPGDVTQERIRDDLMEAEELIRLLRLGTV